MPKKVTVVITGDKALNRKLARLSGKDGKKAIRKGQRAALKPIQKQARQNARDHKRTGNLAKSIKIRSIKRTRSGVGTRVTTGKASGFENEFYGAFVEYDRDGFDGQENMQQAVQSKKQTALDTYKTETAKNITALAKKP